MPRYRQKITRMMNFDELNEVIEDYDPPDRAFLTLLFFAGCRVSEALALTGEDIRCEHDTIYVQFYRLKGSKQTDPTEIPNITGLRYLCIVENERHVFPFSRTTAWRLVKRAFPDLYPHFFRMNRITKVSDRFGDTAVYRTFGICAQSIDHYRGKVDIKRVGAALREEVEE